MFLFAGLALALTAFIIMWRGPFDKLRASPSRQPRGRLAETRCQPRVDERSVAERAQGLVHELSCQTRVHTRVHTGFTRRFTTWGSHVGSGRGFHESSLAATRSEPSEVDRLDRRTKVNDRLGLARAAHEHDNHNGSISSARPGCTDPAWSRLVHSLRHSIDRHPYRAGDAPGSRAWPAPLRPLA